jgi:hypothetical protein
MIKLVFDPPPHPNPGIMMETQALERWARDEEGNKNLINKRWLKSHKKSVKKILVKLKRYDFYEEIRDIITLLAHVFGRRYYHNFENWMFPFNQLILDGKQYLDWA